ncbi:MAG: RNA polymerase sigma factor (sigma-70 family) [Ilumatobacter sp.]|jgi:RNA polymerase sigma factor (sigma-70 family)
MEQFRPVHVVQEDAELALALREGDEAAVRTLYERFGGLVFTVANRILKDRQRAEEVTQHVFLQAWRNAEQFEPGRDFAPWLATIARRAAIDVLRREQRRPAGSLEVADPSDSALVTLPPSAEQIETVWSVRAAIDALEPDERQIVKMQHIDGHTHAEIAERLDLAVGTVKSRSHRAHRRLANRLAHIQEPQS